MSVAIAVMSPGESLTTPSILQHFPQQRHLNFDKSIGEEYTKAWAHYAGWEKTKKPHGFCRMTF
jgi:hypothetical protein